MLIVEPHEIKGFAAIPSGSGTIKVLRHQTYTYVLQKTCQTRQEAVTLYLQNLKKQTLSLILNEPSPSVWIQTSYEQLLKAQSLGSSQIPQPDPNLLQMKSKTLSQPYVNSHPRLKVKPVIAHVEDSKIDSAQMEAIVQTYACEYYRIHNPILALTNLLERKPALIFLDLVMPIVNGYELCAQIRRVAQLKEIPVIIVTSTDSPIDRARAKLVGASGYVTKPFAQTAIQSVLKEHGLVGR